MHTRRADDDQVDLGASTARPRTVGKEVVAERAERRQLGGNPLLGDAGEPEPSRGITGESGLVLVSFGAGHLAAGLVGGGGACYCHGRLRRLEEAAEGVLADDRDAVLACFLCFAGQAVRVSSNEE